MLVFFTATLFMTIVDESGGVVYVVRATLRAFGNNAGPGPARPDGHRPHPGRPDRGRERLAPRRRGPRGHGPQPPRHRPEAGRRHPLHRRRPERRRAAGQHLGHDPLRRHGHPLRRIRVHPGHPRPHPGDLHRARPGARRRRPAPPRARVELPEPPAGMTLVAGSPPLPRLLRPGRRLPDLALRHADPRACPSSSSSPRPRRCSSARRGSPSCRWPEARSRGSCPCSRPRSSSACSSRS
ncbi:MAG: hypothetical protein M0C28_32225 [Candidatus Moduliflexus flocculans]|nr:hypothetical protein [Candidatus Moduliflexus flocculans]